MAWTSTDVKSWRARLRLTQAQAAAALRYHLHAYKKLEYGTRDILAHVQLLCELVEQKYIRGLHSVSGEASAGEHFATPDAVLERMDAIQLGGGSSGKPVARGCGN